MDTEKEDQINNSAKTPEAEQPEPEPKIIPETPQSTGSNKIVLILTGIIFALLLVILAGASYFLYFGKTKDVKKEIVTPQPTLSQPTPTPDPTANWKTYSLTKIGMQFKIPLQMPLSEIIEETQLLPEVPAVTGSMYCAYGVRKSLSLISIAFAGGAMICSGRINDIFTIGGSSPDFSVEREGTFTDFQGFVEQDGKFYVRGVTNTLNEIIGVSVEKVTNPNGVQILKVHGEKLEGPYPWPNEKQIGAIINTNNRTYRGVGFIANLSDIDEKTFNQILSTFKFL